MNKKNSKFLIFKTPNQEIPVDVYFFNFEFHPHYLNKKD
jgi:hypothetical protein